MLHDLRFAPDFDGGFVAFALPNPDVADRWLSSAFAFSINLVTTFQDVAIGGMARLLFAVDVVPQPPACSLPRSSPTPSPTCRPHST